MKRKQFFEKDIPITILAYFAGIVDGEGSFLIAKSRNLKSGKSYLIPKLQITNTSKRLADWIYNNFGGYYQKYPPKPPRVDVYRITIEGHMLSSITEKIMPYLVVKQDQAQIILDFRKSMSQPTACKGKQGIQPISEETRRYREDLADRLRILHNSWRTRQ